MLFGQPLAGLQLRFPLAVAGWNAQPDGEHTRLKDAQKKTIARGMHFCHRLIGGAGSSKCATSSAGTYTTSN